MDSKDDHTTEPSIEREVLLEYLLDQCDSTHRHHLRLGFPFQFLGYAALYHDTERLQEYQDIHLPCYTPFERLQTYQRLFAEALAEPEETPSREVEDPTFPDYPRGTKRRICKKLLVTAIRDGSEMLDSSDFRFLPVFLLIGWLGHRFNSEALQDFERQCVASDGEAQETVQTGMRILKAALGPRAKQSSQLIEPDCYDTGITELTRRISMKTALRRLITRGERLLDGTYGLQEGFAAYESWQHDCHNFFQELQSEFGRTLRSPADVEVGISFLRDFLPSDDDGDPE